MENGFQQKSFRNLDQGFGFPDRGKIKIIYEKWWQGEDTSHASKSSNVESVAATDAAAVKMTSEVTYLCMQNAVFLNRNTCLAGP